MTKTVAVVGGAGSLGSCVVQSLLERGAVVRSVDLYSYTGPKSDQVTSHIIDIAGQEGQESTDALLDKAFEGADGVVHVASIIDIRPIPSLLMERVNVHGTHSVVSACQRAGVRALVYTSSLEVISGYDKAGRRQAPDVFTEDCPVAYKHILPYASTKARAERVVLKANMSNLGVSLLTTCLRPGYIVGANAIGAKIEITKGIKRRNKYITARVPAKISSVAVRNCAVAHLLALDALLGMGPGGETQQKHVQGETFFIADFNENVIDMNILAMSKTDISPVILPFVLASFLCWLQDRFERLLYFIASFGLFPYTSGADVVSVDALDMGWRDIIVSTDKAKNVLRYGAPDGPVLQSKDKCFNEMISWGTEQFEMEKEKNKKTK